jgi:2-oxoisovalerate dehydrogenase E1 component
MLQLGMTPLDMLLGAVGAKDDPNSGGRQMPSHWSSPALHVVTKSSPTGTQFLQAVGCAEAVLYLDETSPSGDRDAIVYCSAGDGTTSEGEFWESLNTASNRRLPVLYLIEDNGYAISVPVEVQTAGGSISRLVRSFPDLLVREVDGCDPLASLAVMKEAAAWCRARRGPALVHARVIRPYSHSLSDDEALYRPADERQEDARRDPPLTAFPGRGGAGHREAGGAARRRGPGDRGRHRRRPRRPRPSAESATTHVYPRRGSDLGCLRGEPRSAGDLRRWVHLLNACLHDEMSRNDASWSSGETRHPAEAPGAGEGQGGVFKVTHNLQRKFGSRRVFNAPLAEANIVGRAIGMANRGLKPVVEIQFMDYIWPAFMQIRNELAVIRWRSNGTWKCPVVIRVTYGGYLQGGAIYHSQCGESLFTHIPGLRVVIPSNAEDASGLLRTAIRADDPKSLEHKHLYRQTYEAAARGPTTRSLRPGVAGARGRGRHHRDLRGPGAALARGRAAGGVRASDRVLDLRTLSPDWGGHRPQREEDGKALVVHTATGPGATGPRSPPGSETALGVARRAGPAHRRPRYLRRLQPRPRERDPPPGVDGPPGDPGPQAVLTGRPA